MALKPGDKVAGPCDRVGNFPFALLDDPNDLQLDANRHLKTIPGSTKPIQHSLPLASLKQEYIDLFKDNSLTVCDKNNFAGINAPLRVSLVGTNISGTVQSGNGIYRVEALGPIRLYRAGNNYVTGWSQSPWWGGNGLVGNITYDMYNGPVKTYYYEQTFLGGFFYRNTTFKCDVKVSYVLENTGEVDAWGFLLYLLHGQLDVSIADDNGEVSHVVEVTSSPARLPALNISINRSVSTSVMGETGELGTLTKSVNVSFYMSSRYQW